jgi:hypothetical protein
MLFSVQVIARYAVSRSFLLLRYVVILSRWIDVGCETFPSLTRNPTNSKAENCFSYKAILIKICEKNTPMCEEHIMCWLFGYCDLWLESGKKRTRKKPCIFFVVLVVSHSLYIIKRFWLKTWDISCFGKNKTGFFQYIKWYIKSNWRHHFSFFLNWISVCFFETFLY